MIPVEYEQTDSRWRDIPYTITRAKNQTIGISGCGPTAAAMVVATLRDKSVTPKEACAWAVDHGYRTKNDGTYWGFFSVYLSKFNIKCTQITNSADAIAALKKGKMVITTVGKSIWTSGGHFFLAYGLSGNKVKIHDPNSEAPYRELAQLSQYQAAFRQGWIIEEEWDVEKKNLEIYNLDTKNKIAVEAIYMDGANYIKLRDCEKLFPCAVGWNGKEPTVKLNYKE